MLLFIDSQPEIDGEAAAVRPPHVPARPRWPAGYLSAGTFAHARAHGIEHRWERRTPVRPFGPVFSKEALRIMTNKALLRVHCVRCVCVCTCSDKSRSTREPRQWACGNGYGNPFDKRNVAASFGTRRGSRCRGELRRTPIPIHF